MMLSVFLGCMVYSSDSSETDSQGSQEPIKRKQLPLPANQHPGNQVIVAPVHYANQGPYVLNPYANDQALLTNQKTHKPSHVGQRNLNQSSCVCCLTENSRHICIPMDIIPDMHAEKCYQPLSVRAYPSKVRGATSLLSDSGCHSHSESSHSEGQSDSDVQSTVTAASEDDGDCETLGASALNDSRDIPDDGSTTTEGSYVLHQSDASLDLTDAELSESQA